MAVGNDVLSNTRQLLWDARSGNNFLDVELRSGGCDVPLDWLVIDVVVVRNVLRRHWNLQ